MEILIFILFIIIIYIVIKSFETKYNISKLRTRNKIHSEIDSFNGSLEVTSDEFFYYPPVKKDKDNGWILNPGSTFILTVKNCDKIVANEIRKILESYFDYKNRRKLLEIFCKHNVLVKEIEEYKSKYKPKYLAKIQELQENSVEWKNAYEADKNDLMIEFREKALDALYERPNVDLVKLFEEEPTDLTIDDEIINEYGFENIYTYLRYYDSINEIKIIPKSHFERERFEELEKLNLAERGYNLPKEEILLSLTLKELNLIANHPDKKFNRKKQAVDYILSKPNLDELIGRHISFREIFKLKPLPTKYSQIELTQISKNWLYTEVVVELLEKTFIQAYEFDEIQRKFNEYLVGYKVSYHRDEIHCQCCLELSNKTFLKNELTKFPLHIGCSCFIEPVYNFD